MSKRRLQINPEKLDVVPASKRAFWEQLRHEVELDVAGKFRRKWSLADTARVVLADPTESYEDLARELDRSPGAIRYRRMAMVHLIRDEANAQQRVLLYRDDPRENHKHHDYHQIDAVLEGVGIYDLPVSEQFRLAKPLRQPRPGWRGDGTGAALADGTEVQRLRERLKEATRDFESRRDDG